VIEDEKTEEKIDLGLTKDKANYNHAEQIDELNIYGLIHPWYF